MIGEITLGLAGVPGGDGKLADMLLASAATGNAGCPKGLVDAAGHQ
jgi:ribonuclease T2